MQLSDAQWSRVEALIPEPFFFRRRRGRPWRDARQVLEGILWVLRSGAAWMDLPQGYPPYRTCHRRYQHWSDDGTLELVLEALAQDGAGDLRDALRSRVRRKAGPRWSGALDAQEAPLPLSASGQ
jgi:transposase